MIKVLALALGALMSANGVFMFIEPAAWYDMVPGVPATGPFNIHFVRDIGLAFLTAGVGLLWSENGGGWKTSALGAMFLGLHAALHAGETIYGHHHDVLANEALAVHLPALLAVVVSFAQFKAQR